jgi:carbonyl reductase 1
MSGAQTRAEVAAWPVDLVADTFYGELVQFGKVLPWASFIPLPHTAAA